MPPSLAEQQRALAARILGSGSPALEGWVEVPDGAEIAPRIAAHVDGYPARIQEAIEESHPAVAKILGSATLRDLIGRLLPRLDSGPRNLNEVGAGLSTFLADDPLSTGLPFLPDLAALEWAIVRAFHRAIEPAFDPRSCAQWSPEDWNAAQIRFQPGTSLVRSVWPLRALREVRNLDRSEIDVALEHQPDRVLIHRRGFDVETLSLSETAADIFEMLHAGVTLGDVMEELDERGVQPEAVNESFASWRELGLIVACHHESRGANR